MKHNQNNRRQRSRGNGRRYPNQRGGAFESNGPEVKVRGTAQQVLEKYQSLARDAFSSGDRILAEGYLQHAEHYYRILNADNEGQGKDQNRDNGRNRSGRGNRDDDSDDNDDNDTNENEDVAAKKNGKGDSHKGDNDKGDNKKSDDAASDSDSESDVAAAKQSDVAAAKESDGDSGEEEPRPRRPRGRRPRKTEQPKIAAVDAAPQAEQPAAGD